MCTPTLPVLLRDVMRPFTGIGSWGRYSGYEQITWQANPDGGLFLHSGVLHVALKCGLPGIALLAGTICAFVLAARFRRPIPIIAGIAAATLLNHAIAGWLGVFLSG
mgnify:CR=1 FL=1